MRIAILITGFDLIGGAEIAARNIARQMAKMGHEVHVITKDYKGLPRCESIEGFTIHRMRYPDIPGLRVVFNVILSLLELRKLKNGIDIVHAQSFTPNGIAAVLSKIILHRPAVVKGVGGDLYQQNWLKRKTVIRFVLKNADAVLVLGGEDMRRKAMEVWRGDVITVTDGIDVDSFRMLDRKSLRKGFGFGRGKVVLFVGRLTSVKGIDRLIMAMKNVTKACPGSRLIIIGDGEERKGLELLASRMEMRNIAFLGAMDNSEVVRYMAAADVFVLPSLSEAFPIVVAEAMAAGVPVVATRCGAIPEMLENGRCGMLIEPGSEAQISDSVIRLLGDTGLGYKLAGAARKKSEWYDWSAVARKLEGIYIKTLSGYHEA